MPSFNQETQKSFWIPKTISFRDKKAQELSINTLIILIIVIVVLVATIFFWQMATGKYIFPEIMDKFKTFFGSFKAATPKI